eukprot:TRINITY_DN4718_c0_g1_i1.p1 TRINITY_DN4718_c0_g1~~TRINITY_DN4718_c0_g1_i1.p1  ORF type:complete len:1760 (-),score=229.92 TRINITY_DN4718_c0_g1_i1:4961-9508(-)
MDGCSFESLSSQGNLEMNGGAIFFQSPDHCQDTVRNNSDLHQLLIKNSYISASGFQGRASAGNAVGGALGIRGPGINATIVDTEFRGNSAISGVAFSAGHIASGGAIFAQNSPPGGRSVSANFMSRLYIQRCYFDQNKAQSGSVERGGDENLAPGAPFGSAAPSNGGAVGTEGYVEINIVDSLFTNNTCMGGSGGAVGGDSLGAAVSVTIPIDTEVRFAMPPISITNTTFFGNYAVGGAAFRDLIDRGGSRAFGGAVHIFLGLGVTTPINIQNCSFYQNSVLGGSFGYGYGGAFSLLSAGSTAERPIKFTNLFFQENKAMGGYAYGGAMSLTGYLGGRDGASFQHVTFRGNSAIGGVEGPEIFDDPTSKIKHRMYAANVAEGGAIYLATNRGPWDGPGFLQNSRFDDSYFLNNMAVNIDLDYLGLLDSEIVTKGLVTGGAISAKELHNMDFKNCFFGENTAIGAAGSAVFGGALYSNNAKVISTTFRENRALTQVVQDPQIAATVSGGAAACFFLNCDHCLFESNTVNGSNPRGGAIFVSHSVTLMSCIIRNSFVESVFGSATGGGAFVDDLLDAVPIRANIVLSIFDHNIAVANGKGDSSFGGGLSLPLDDHSGLLLTNLTKNQADFGGGLYISTLYHRSYRYSPYFEGNTANKAGASIFINTNNDVDNRDWEPSLLGTVVRRNITFDMDNIARMCNESEHGPIRPGSDFCATPIEKLVVYRPTPDRIWPGMLFSTKLKFLDLLGHTAVAPSAIIRVTAAAAYTVPVFETDFGGESEFNATYDLGHSNAETPSLEGVYLFSGLRVRLAPGMTVRLNFTSKFADGPTAILYPTYRPTPNRTYENPIFQTVSIAQCPPGYLLRHLSGQEYDCARCPPGTYTIGSQGAEEECLSCSSGSHGHSILGDCLIAPDSLVEDAEVWTIQPGFYPISAEDRYIDAIFACPNRHACLGSNCSLLAMEENHNHSFGQTLWSLNCSGSTFCEEGYTDRLCSRCECDVNDAQNCFFAANGEEFVCRRCQAPGTAVLVSAGLLIIFSLVAFLLFQHSTVAIFVAEVLVAVLLLVLGLGEWWFFDVVIVSAVLFLISRGATRKLMRKEELVEKQHHQSAYFIGIVKVSLFFLQTTAAVLPSETWPKLVSQVVETLNSFSLRISGVECLYPSIYSIPAAKFGLLMSAPILIVLVMALSTGIAMLLSKLAFVKKLQALEARFSLRRSCRKCCRRRSDVRRDVASEPPSSNTSDASDAESEPSLEPSDAESEAEEALLAPSPPLLHAPIGVKNSFWPRLQYSALFVLFASQFELSNVVLANLKGCEEGYMPASPWIKCSWAGDSPQYVWLQSLSYVCLVLYVIGIPALFTFLLVRNRKKILQGAEEVEHRMGFLYETYKRDVFFFEAIWLLRRVLLSVAIALIPATTGFRNAAISLILLVSLFVQQRFKPFSSSTVNTIETLSTTTLLYSFSVGSELATNHSMEWRGVLQLLLWIFNCLVVLVLLGALLKPVVKRIGARCVGFYNSAPRFS